jgi:hypothetical protein
MTPRSTLPRRAAVIAAAVIAGLLAVGEARATNVKAGIASPLRAGQQPGCRWVLGAAKTIRVCDANKVCRTQTVPAQRIWACGTVRD